MTLKEPLTLDHELSARYRTPTLLPPKQSPLTTVLREDESYWAEREGKKNPSFGFYRLRPSHALEYLQRIAVAHGLVYKGKRLTCDFFTRLSLEYLVEPLVDGFLVHALLANKNLNDYSLILQGVPHIAIKQELLYFIDPNISWQELSGFSSGPKKLSKDEYRAFKRDTEALIIELEAPVVEQTPPTLLLSDATCSFVRLQDGKDEKELLQAGFVKKAMESSDYYCPTDRSVEALQQLLKQGWRVFDATGREVVASTESHLEIDKAFHIQGKITFGKEAVDLHPILTTLQQNRRLMPLASGKSGLLAFDKPLERFFHEVELVSEQLKVPKRELATLSEISEIIGDRLQAACRPSVHSPHSISSLFVGTLRSYQQEGLNWLSCLYERGLNGLLADEMGLGKTVQVLAFLADMAGPNLIVVPTSLLFQWGHEIARFLPTKTFAIYHGPDRRSNELERTDIIITSYNTLRSDLELFQSLNLNCLIVDEAQAIKNGSTLTAQALCALSSRFRLSLTGTPVENSLSELVSHFQFLEPDLLDAKQDISLLRKQIGPFFMRRKKRDVAKELPEKIEQTLYVAMHDGQESLYSAFLGSLRAGLLTKIQSDGAKKHRMQIFEAILRLRQICCHPLLVSQLVSQFDDTHSATSAKFELVLEDIQTLIAEGKKVVLFSQFASMLKLFAKEAQSRSWPYLLLDGQTHERQGLVDTFQNDENVPLFFISLKAGGVGLNLTRADYVLLYDPWWNRAQEAQAVDRAHRIGRKEPVFIKRYILKHSIEEKIEELQHKKQALHDALFEAEGDSPSLDTLVDLLNLQP